MTLLRHDQLRKRLAGIIIYGLRSRHGSGEKCSRVEKRSQTRSTNFDGWKETRRTRPAKKRRTISTPLLVCPFSTTDHPDEHFKIDLNGSCCVVTAVGVVNSESCFGCECYVAAPPAYNSPSIKTVCCVNNPRIHLIGFPRFVVDEIQMACDRAISVGQRTHLFWGSTSLSCHQRFPSPQTIPFAP